MPIAWHPKGWCNFSMSEDENKEIEPIFTELCFWYIQYGSIRTFWHIKTWYSSKIFGDIRKYLKQFSTCSNFKMSKFFLWTIYILGNIRIVWHMKT